MFHVVDLCKSSPSFIFKGEMRRVNINKTFSMREHVLGTNIHTTFLPLIFTNVFDI